MSPITPDAISITLIFKRNGIIIQPAEFLKETISALKVYWALELFKFLDICNIVLTNRLSYKKERNFLSYDY